MNDDWRSRNTLTGRDALKVALAVLGLLAGCIALAWVLTKSLHHPPPSEVPAVEK